MFTAVIVCCVLLLIAGAILMGVGKSYPVLITGFILICVSCGALTGVGIWTGIQKKRAAESVTLQTASDSGESLEESIKPTLPDFSELPKAD